MKLTPSEENYLLAIDNISNGDRVSTNELASETGLSAASVTDMIQKLAEKGLVHYEKYRGVELLPSGRSAVNQINQNLSLWKEFLNEKLQYSESESEELLQDLRHIQSPTLSRRLQNYLNNTQDEDVMIAQTSPKSESHIQPKEHKDTTHQVENHIAQRQQQFKQAVPQQTKYIESKANKPTLDNCSIGEMATILGISDLPNGLQQLINHYQFMIGSSISVVNRFEFDNSLLISYNNEHYVVSQKFAQLILIRKSQ